MDLKQILDRKINRALIVDAPVKLTLTRFLELAFDWKLSDAQILRGLRQFGLGVLDGELLPVMAGGATPVIMTDATTALDAANLNKYLNAEGKTSVKILYGRIDWSSGTTFVIASGVDSAGIVSGDLSWDATNKRVQIALTGYTAIPMMFASRQSDNNFSVAASVPSTSQGTATWYDGQTKQTVPDANYTAMVQILGI